MSSTPVQNGTSTRGGAFWQDRALCKAAVNSGAADYDLWFPHKGGGPQGEAANRQIAAAKAWCGQCPVWRECRDRADQLGNQTEGVWGGLTKDERYQLRRARQRRSAAARPAVGADQ